MLFSVKLMRLAILLGKEGKTILCDRCENYYKGFNKCMKKEKGEINLLVYMGKWRALVGVEPKFFPWQRALSEHVEVTK